MALSFYGEYEHSIDDKGRVTLPSRFREELQDGLVMAYWLESCIGVFGKEEFDKLGAELSSMPTSSKEVRSMSRVLFSRASEGVPDRQGRINIPANLRRMAGLDREVVIVGVRNHLEIWQKSKWQQYVDEGAETYAQNAESLTDRGF